MNYLLAVLKPLLVNKSRLHDDVPKAIQVCVLQKFQRQYQLEGNILFTVLSFTYCTYGDYKHSNKGDIILCTPHHFQSPPPTEPSMRRFLRQDQYDEIQNIFCYLLSTSLMLCCRICCKTLGLSNSFWILAMMLSESSFC